MREDGSKREYYVVPGGKMEYGETEEETVVREIHEELGINVRVGRKIIEYSSDYDDSIQIFYLCEYIDGILGTGDGPEIINKSEYMGLFEPVIVNKKVIKDINLVPVEIKSILEVEVNESCHN